MNLRPIVAVAVVALAVVACGPQESATDSDTTWVGTITTEVNESGSVWGGTARLRLRVLPAAAVFVTARKLMLTAR